MKSDPSGLPQRHFKGGGIRPNLALVRPAGLGYDGNRDGGGGMIEQRLDRLEAKTDNMGRVLRETQGDVAVIKTDIAGIKKDISWLK
jgi:hypothetical protein